MDHERNERAWRDARHWIGLRWLGFYRAPEDSRLWVPKVPRVFGWTVNLAHPAGMAVLAGLVAAALLVAVVAVVLDR